MYGAVNIPVDGDKLLSHWREYNRILQLPHCSYPYVLTRNKWIQQYALSVLLDIMQICNNPEKKNMQLQLTKILININLVKNSFYISSIIIFWSFGTKILSPLKIKCNFLKEYPSRCITDFKARKFNIWTIHQDSYSNLICSCARSYVNSCVYISCIFY